MQQKVILFAILNWGLGHASRSIPLIKYLQSKGYKLVICTDGHVVSFLEKELDHVVFEYLPAYNIRYSYSSMAINMAIQLPKIYSAYRKEKQVFEKLVDQYKPSLCFSDNRYGCNSKKVPTYFIGHQWNILYSVNKVSHIASSVNQYFIRKFQGYLVPDRKQDSLSGKLTANISHPNVDWLGILSRFSSLENKVQKEKTFMFLAILSGPEPSRTTLEKKLIHYCKKHKDEQFAIVRGIDQTIDELFPSNCLCYNIIAKEKLEELILASKVIVGRSGYSSVMDYISMGLQDVLFIPTPGQTEQEYLASRLEEIGFLHLQENKLTNATLNDALSMIMSREKTENIKKTHVEYGKVLDKILHSAID